MGNKNVVDMTIRANMDLSNITSDISQIQNYLKKISLSPETRRSFDGLLDEALSDLEKIQKRIDKGFKTKGDVIGFEKAASGVDATFKKIENKLFKLYNLSDKELFKLDPKLKGDIEAIEKKFANIAEDFPKTIKDGLKGLDGIIANFKKESQKKAGKEIVNKVQNKDYTGALALAEKKLKAQKNVLANNPAAEKTVVSQIETYKEIIKVLKEAVIYQDQFNNKAKYLETEKAERYEQTLKLIKGSLEGAQAAANNASKGFGQISSSIRNAGEETVNFNSELDSIKQRVAYFFSLTNSVMMFRRILQDTINTTKELDAAMTETAVVTDFSVADMWKDLPRYTKVAKELGTTIKGVYETMTLYYQQGLKTEETFEVGTETLKMARIAGLEYAQATDFMTAALRGFNMEVNELNAQKVNDVYSELAAITAADTKEIATAMTKTASIASSANMEFETTAAFLSQIIETTRESAETAGTAMKTVIARFTELKKDPAEIGEVDGEIVDANKIETALRTIDVALRGTNGQFRDLDDVFLDIAAKWEGLDTNTQRYIATMAAGSRQQSRFIAMMSDYSRTMELVNAANNSAGASQRQFDKTLESLESKLNQLKDAWDQFTMGIANNTLIKAGVDALTGFINILNKITEKLPGASKGIANLLLLFGGFKAGGKLARAFSASILADLVDLSKGAKEAGERTGISFRDALIKEFSTTKNIFKKENFIGTIFGNTSKYNDKLKKDLLKLNQEINQRRETSTRFSISGRDTSSFDKETAKRIDKQNILQQEQLKFSKASTLQKQTYLALLDAEIPKETALLALNGKLNDEKYKEIAIQSLLNGTNKLENELTEEEIKERITLIKTKAAEQSVDKMGLLTKTKEIAALLFAKPHRKQEAADRLAAAGATWAQKAAQDGLNASIFAFPIGWIVAGITALVGGLILLAKWSKTQTLDYKMEKAAETTEKAKQAAENAKQAYDDLNDSIESLKTAEQDIDNLTQGTVEWQKAVLELNNQIMELIEQFPELRNQLLNELQVEANGKLTLSSTGYELIKQQSAERYKNTIAGQTIAATQEAYLRKEKGLQDFNNFNELSYKINQETGEKEKASKVQKAAGAQWITEDLQAQKEYSSLPFQGFVDLILKKNGYKTVGEAQQEHASDGIKLATSKYELTTFSQEDKEKIYSEYVKNPKIFIEGNTDLGDFASNLGMASEALLEFIPAMRKRREAELEYEASVRAQAQQLILSTTSDMFQNREDSSQIANTFAEFFTENQDELINQEALKIEKAGNDLTDYAKQFGITNFINQGDTTKSLEKLYQELTGSTQEQVEEMFGGNEKELRKAIARIQVGKDWGKKVENFAKELDKFTHNMPNAQKIGFKQLFGGANGTGFTREGIKQFKNYTEQQLTDLFNSSDSLKKQFNNDESAFIKWAKNQVEQADLIFENAGEKLSSIGLSLDDFDAKLSADAVKGISEKFEEIFYKGGDVEGLKDKFNNIVKGLAPEQVDRFSSALLAIDWNSVGSIEDLKNNLYDMGVYIPQAELESFTDDIIKFNKASRAVDLNQLNAQLSSTQDLIEEISERERGERSFTKEEMDKLVSSGVDKNLFVGYGDKWQYVGSSLDTLTEALRENTQAVLKDTVGKLEDQLEVAQAASEFAKGEYGEDLINHATKNTADKQTILAGFLNSLAPGTTTIGGYSIEALKGLTSGKLDVNQQSFLSEFLKTIADSIGTEKSIETQIEATQRQQGILKYSGKSTNEIVAAATQEETEENQTEIKNATDALLYKAAAYTELDDEIRAYNEAVKNGTKEEINNAKRVLASQTAISEKAEALNDLDDKVESHIQNLKKTKSETTAYDDILGDLTEDLNEAFGTDLTTDFFKKTPENLILLEQALEGSQEAWDALILKIQAAQVATIDFEEQYGVSGNNIAAITEALNGLTFGINGEADMTQVLSALIAAGMTAEQVASFLEELGYTNIEFSVDNQIQNLDDLKDPTKWDKIKGKLSLKATNVNIPAARSRSSFGAGGPVSGTKSGNPDGSGNEWENPYDSFYNINADINKLIEERNELEKEHEKILKDENSSIEDIANSYTNRIESYNNEIALQKEMLRLRQQEQKQLLKDNSDLQKYAWIKDGKVQIDFAKIDKITDEELGKRIEDYISALEENTKEIQNAEAAIYDAELTVVDIIGEWRDETAAFEREIFDAIVYAREKEIEGMEEIADAFDQSTQDLVSAIQEEINTRRQNRENEEIEEDILDKERRLAYLQQDTSGANDAEILQLQKELTEQKEDYTDTLIDQKISELEKQNNEAAKQRNQQIQIARSQLKYDQESGIIAKEVKELLKGTSAEGKGNWQSIFELLMQKDGFKGLTETEKEVWQEKTTENFKSALAFLDSDGKDGLKSLLKDIKVENNYYYQPSSNNGNGSNGNGTGGNVGGSSPSNTSNTSSIAPKSVQVNDIKSDAKGISYYKINGKWYKASDTTGWNQDEGTTTLKSGAQGKANLISPAGTVSKDIDLGKGTTAADALNEAYQKGSFDTVDQVRYFVYNGQYYYFSDLKTSKTWLGKNKAYIPKGTTVFKKYRTGGLADYTGPAWLDGTKSKPELVLNQKDTQNFLQLKDVLGSFMKNKTNVTNNNTQTGDTNFEISITVEKMNSDYDVEDVANKIKQMISSDAMYRNSNFISRLR